MLVVCCLLLCVFVVVGCLFVDCCLLIACSCVC